MSRRSLPASLGSGLIFSTCMLGYTGLWWHQVRRDPGEAHLTHLRQLTAGGTNAEAYFSADGQWLVFQTTRRGRPCDQEYVMRVDGTGLSRVSTGTGKTTCGYF